jgi:hypothetical protein
MIAVVETVDKIEPSHGPDFGETIVNLWGSGFLDSPLLSCQFGTVSISAVWHRDDLVECQTPPMPAGTEVAIRIANNGIDFSTSFLVFKYYGNLDLRFS